MTPNPFESCISVGGTEESFRRVGSIRLDSERTARRGIASVEYDDADITTGRITLTLVSVEMRRFYPPTTVSATVAISSPNLSPPAPVVAQFPLSIEKRCNPSRCDTTSGESPPMVQYDLVQRFQRDNERVRGVINFHSSRMRRRTSIELADGSPSSL